MTQIFKTIVRAQFMNLRNKTKFGPKNDQKMVKIDQKWSKRFDIFRIRT